MLPRNNRNRLWEFCNLYNSKYNNKIKKSWSWTQQQKSRWGRIYNYPLTNRRTRVRLLCLLYLLKNQRLNYDRSCLRPLFLHQLFFPHLQENYKRARRMTTAISFVVCWGKETFLSIYFYLYFIYMKLHDFSSDLLGNFSNCV